MVIWLECGEVRHRQRTVAESGQRAREWIPARSHPGGDSPLRGAR